MNLSLLSQKLLFVITDAGTESKVDRVFSEMHLPIYYQFHCRGTARTELLDICGLEGRTRLVTVTIMPKSIVKRTFEKLTETFRMHKRGKGVAVTVPVTGMQERLLTLLDVELTEDMKNTLEKEKTKMKEESLYSMILVSVKNGYSANVIDAAASAGAKGGSVIRGRRCGTEAMAHFLGVSLQDEQEFVMIVVPKEKKSSIMKSIGSSCGLHTEAHGFVISVPVEDALGIGID